MVEKVLVSVIIPMYNCERYIKRCIESLLNQTYSDIQIIVVDDGGYDNSANIVRELCDKDRRIIYVYQNNSGPGIARNKAIGLSTGKYLLFVDADDYLGKDYIESMVRCAEENKSELVIAGYTLVYENKNKEKIVIPKKYIREDAEEWAYRISSCCSRLYLKKFWELNELEFNKEKNARAEDVPIVLYSNVMARNVSIVKNRGYFYYQHTGSAMNNKKKRVLFEFPYVAFEEMYKKVLLSEINNSLDFFYVGILKFLAHFTFVIYRRADKSEKKKFEKYIFTLLKNEYDYMVRSWNSLKYKIQLPIIHKIAIQLFVNKYKRIM